MKSAPYRMEDDSSDILTAWFTKHGLSPVERIPVTGRTGPDIQMNEAKLLIDVKNRLAVPKSYMIEKNLIVQFGAQLMGVQLSSLDLLLTDHPIDKVISASSIVADWFNHNAQWEKAPVGAIPALIVRRPIRGLRRERAVLIIRINDRPRLKERLCQA